MCFSKTQMQRKLQKAGGQKKCFSITPAESISINKLSNCIEKIYFHYQTEMHFQKAGIVKPLIKILELQNCQKNEVF